MQLKLTRSQRDGGIVSKSVLFCLDARVQFTREEQANVSRYRLGGQLIYNSQASQQRVKAGEAAMADGKGAGNLKALAQFALARLHLNITVDSLQRGQHIECKSLDELLEAEDALMEACKNLRMYLDTAATFDGREVLFDFSSSAPTVISAAPPPMLAAQPFYPPPPYAAAPPPVAGPPTFQQGADTSAQTWHPETSRPHISSVQFKDLLVAIDQHWRASSPKKQALIIAVGLLVLLFLYEIF